MPTQLYVSLDAPNEKLYKKIDRPVTGSWKKLQETLELLQSLKKKTRTVIRITAIKGLNMKNEKEYARLIEKANPLFVEVKAYMAVGFSRKRLGLKFMPSHEEVKEFSKKISEHSSYKLVDEKENSRVVLLMEEDTKERKIKFD